MTAFFRHVSAQKVDRDYLTFAMSMKCSKKDIADLIDMKYFKKANKILEDAIDELRLRIKDLEKNSNWKYVAWYFSITRTYSFSATNTYSFSATNIYSFSATITYSFSVTVLTFSVSPVLTLSVSSMLTLSVLPVLTLSMSPILILKRIGKNMLFIQIINL